MPRFPLASCTLAIALFLTALIATDVWAGPNEEGVLIVHAGTGAPYTGGYDGCAEFVLDQCTEAIVDLPASSSPLVWYVTSVFPATSNPEVSGLTFGVHYDPAVLTIFTYGACADFELPDSGWPDPGTGTAITWSSPNRERILENYWFAGYDYYGQATTFSVGDSERPAVWVDNSLPGILDPPVAFGAIGFAGGSSSLPCPIDGEPGACCIDLCECLITSEEDCSTLGGTFTEGADCSPEICGCPPSACCFEDGTCSVLEATECEDLMGVFLEGQFCDPNPCPQPALGACCLPDGSCSDLTAADCESVSGLFSDGECASVSCCEPAEGRFSRTGGGNGPNQGGVLILHANEQLIYSGGGEDLCGQSDLLTCRDAVTELDPDDSFVFHLLAAFPASTTPDVGGIIFGISYPTCFTLIRQEACNGGVLLDSGSWPESGSGAGISYVDPIQDGFFEVMWFAGTVDPGQVATFAIVDHPSQGGPSFYDSSVPSNRDYAVDVGVLGFRTEGYLPCPEEAEACCFSDGLCELLTVSDCEAAGGGNLPGVESCDPNPCDTVPVVETTWGKIKGSFRKP